MHRRAAVERIGAVAEPRRDHPDIGRHDLRDSVEPLLERVKDLAGKLRRYRIRVVLGDRVTVAVSPYDLTKGRIVYRHK